MLSLQMWSHYYRNMLLTFHQQKQSRHPYHHPHNVQRTALHWSRSFRSAHSMLRVSPASCVQLHSLCSVCSCSSFTSTFPPFSSLFFFVCYILIRHRACGVWVWEQQIWRMQLSLCCAQWEHGCFLFLLSHHTQHPQTRGHSSLPRVLRTWEPKWYASISDLFSFVCVVIKYVLCCMNVFCVIFFYFCLFFWLAPNPLRPVVAQHALPTRFLHRMQKMDSAETPGWKRIKENKIEKELRKRIKKKK